MTYSRKRCTKDDKRGNLENEKETGNSKSNHGINRGGELEMGPLNARGGPKEKKRECTLCHLKFRVSYYHRKRDNRIFFRKTIISDFKNSIVFFETVEATPRSKDRTFLEIDVICRHDRGVVIK